MEVTISIDDLHPEPGWGCEGDTCVSYLEELNKEFGCKFTLFVPSNYHRKYPLSKHKDWVDFWNKNGYLVIVVSNQSGVGRGFYSVDDVSKLHIWINKQLSSKGAYIDKFYFQYSSIYSTHSLKSAGRLK